ncbi:MAG: thiol-disulfide oxidoreductase DCC family protein [Chitinophagaceae bacterium]|jgi:predicted DCC family thiol-disulfide oxidoreductase YuxK|nr:thiol-disulfide oxidoreductase DCC family protein [Chitinophagaceae bacterium]MBP6047505.1 thiol-disulfide oxidoreductase DCC family protein [Ferruginibacter sp.]MBK7348068.1 thiol-disulfide oxidoreductase DCC family protein [Chitinophagaceae bacterium]MBK8929832.1 thiol-disulfide oxidoreductase DCC family protein [Chitinophagaceae bacterium]MBP6370696.1 thiol-disulfide oxidoreductase DCC family protein [Ferruginibacter sp.]
MVSSSPIILFDGICNLCNRSVQFIIKHDKEKVYRFAAFQSKAGQKLLQQYNLPLKQYSSFLLIENNKAYSQSTAALKVAKNLSGLVKLAVVFNIVPAGIRNIVYNFVARNRYQWFGKKESCMVPTQDLKARFLTDD